VRSRNLPLGGELSIQRDPVIDLRLADRAKVGMAL